MTLKKRIYELLYYLIMGMVVAVAISVNMIAGTVIEFTLKDVILFSLVFIIAVYILFFNRYTIVITLGLVAAMSVLSYFLLRDGGAGESWFAGFSYEIDDLLDFILGVNTYTDRFDYLLGVAIVFLVSVIVGVTIRTSAGFYVIGAMGAFSIAVPAVNDWNVSELGILLFIFGFIILLLEKLNSFVIPEKGSGRSESINAGYVLMFIPLGVAVLFLSTLMSKPDVTQVNVVKSIRNSSLFFDESTVDIASFSEQQGDLGGPANLNDDFVMEVTTHDPTLKLTGHIYDSYNGAGWSKTQAEQIQLEADKDDIYHYSPYSTEEAAMQKSLARAMAVREKTVVVNVYGKRTKNLYTPAFGNNISFGDKNGVSMAESGELSAKNLISIDGEYTQTYTGWSFSSGSLVYTIREGLEERGYPWEAEIFLQLPTTTPSRVKELAQQLIVGANNDYDKLKAIETYLRTFPYTLEPPEVPQGVDFVDHFLFESQTGYCVYYATAMVVLGRSVGIPMRYVEGFVMPSYRNVNSNFSVTNKEAHAWPEAYIPGFGWLSFEPTAAYGAAGYTRDGGAGSEAEFTMPEREARSESEEEENPAREEKITDPIVPLLDEEGEIESEGAIGDPLEPIKSWKLPIVVIVAFAVLGLVTFVLIKRYQKHRKRLEKTTTKELREQVVDYFVYTLNILGGLGYHRTTGETAIDFAQRAGEGLDEPILTEAAHLFSRVYYSENSVSNEEGKSIKEIYEKLYRRLEKQEKKGKFFTRKYIFLRY